jgi:hypothetical protein
MVLSIFVSQRKINIALWFYLVAVTLPGVSKKTVLSGRVLVKIYALNVAKEVKIDNKEMSLVCNP